MPILPPPGLERPPGDVTGDGDTVQVIEAGPTQMTVGHVEPRRFDDVDRNAEARREAEHRSGVLGNVRLEKGKAWHSSVIGGWRACVKGMAHPSIEKTGLGIRGGK